MKKPPHDKQERIKQSTYFDVLKTVSINDRYEYTNMKVIVLIERFVFVTKSAPQFSPSFCQPIQCECRLNLSKIEQKTKRTASYCTLSQVLQARLQLKNANKLKEQFLSYRFICEQIFLSRQFYEEDLISQFYLVVFLIF